MLTQLSLSALTVLTRLLGVSEASGEKIAQAVQTFVEPILILGFGLAAATFLFKRQVTQFFQFAGIAVLIGVFWWKGDVVVKGVATFLSGLFS